MAFNYIEQDLEHNGAKLTTIMKNDLKGSLPSAAINKVYTTVGTETYSTMLKFAKT